MVYPITEHLAYSVMHLSGEVDLNESPNVRNQILKIISKKNPLLVDLSKVEYIDSSGVACLVEGLQTSRAQGTDFALIGVSDAVMQVLQLARLDSVFTLYHSLTDVT